MIVIISGGQTGVDRGALDAAADVGYPVTGMVPKGWLTEDASETADVMRQRYPSLIESTSRSYPPRTRWNVENSTGVIIIVRGGIERHRGTMLTYRLARRLNRPAIVIDPDDGDGIARALAFVMTLGRATRVMIAGPRESGDPGVYEAARGWTAMLLRRLR